MLRFLLVPLTRPYVLDFLDHVRAEIARVLARDAGVHAEALIWPFIEAPTMRCFNWERRQYLGTCILEWLHKRLNEVIQEGYLVVGIGYLDGYETGLNFVFGVASSRLGVCTVFTKRLYPLFYGEKLDLNLYVDRIVKEALHEIGHLLGLGHCPERSCVMSFSNSILDVDKKPKRYCPNCAARIKSYISRTK